MERFWIQGVVKGGQVLLDKPLDLPDGTIVTVMDYDPDDDPRPTEPAEPHDPVKARRALFESLGRPELADDPDWRSKWEKPRD
jgi:hypothetical protein